MEGIGQRVRHARERLAWSQEDLRERTGITIATLSRIENNRLADRPRPSTIRKLAEALGVTPAWLLYGEDDRGNHD